MPTSTPAEAEAGTVAGLSISIGLDLQLSLVREAIKFKNRENFRTFLNYDLSPPPFDNSELFDFQNILEKI